MAETTQVAFKDPDGSFGRVRQITATALADFQNRGFVEVEVKGGDVVERKSKAPAASKEGGS